VCRRVHSWLALGYLGCVNRSEWLWLDLTLPFNMENKIRIDGEIMVCLRK